jgi:hypothetical protein
MTQLLARAGVLAAIALAAAPGRGLAQQPPAKRLLLDLAAGKP